MIHIDKSGYVNLRDQIARAWASTFDKRFPGGAPQDRAALLAVVPVYYRNQVLATGRPFLSRSEARNPKWFSPEEIVQWPPLDGLDRARTATVTAAYQDVVMAAWQECMAGTDSWLAPAVWMASEDLRSDEWNNGTRYARSSDSPPTLSTASTTPSRASRRRC